MVAVMTFSRSFHNVLNYNEQKVQEQVATCLEARNYPKKAEDLTFDQRLRMLEKYAELNQRTKVNCVHISLNFHPTEQFEDEKLRDIAGTYMQKIGFGNQPYLLYRHNDAGHPHVHIVTTNIRSDGKRIGLHNLGKNQSEKARKEIDVLYGLIRAEDSKINSDFDPGPVNVQKVIYGKTATKKAMTVVLNKVLKEYKFSSLPELNAVLNQYNITADRGSAESRIYKNNGLVYRILDEHGNKVGVPIKASDFYNKPTLKVLEELYRTNDPLKSPFRSRVKNAVDMALLKNRDLTLSGLAEALKKEGIHLVARENEQGLIYGITFVDHRTKCVFKGSDLGKQYSAKGLQERCGIASPGAAEISLNPSGKYAGGGRKEAEQTAAQSPGTDPSEKSLLEILLQPEQTNNPTPFELKRKRKRRTRRPSNN